ncbi:hypothetical protein QC762_0114780 [Podospora pseudocomata]|uniref:Uncharacterized protein n=1 Tax=Podospora pseudocomata TaxID=2093779 RepID=A0ABR0G576_9PEZI|nr:hypothetical protein QC762_0114780 [Podospora pseudocomata]
MNPQTAPTTSLPSLAAVAFGGLRYIVIPSHTIWYPALGGLLLGLGKRTNITPGTLGGFAPISYPHSGSLGNPPVVSILQAASGNPGTMMPSLHVHEPANVVGRNRTRLLCYSVP